MTIVELMLSIRKDRNVYYHKDTDTFDYFPISKIELEQVKQNMNDKLPYKDTNNFMLPTYEEIDHEEMMRQYTKEFVEDKELRKQLFYILRRHDYMDAYLEKLQELGLYDGYVEFYGDIYNQIFWEWADANDLVFK